MAITETNPKYKGVYIHKSKTGEKVFYIRYVRKLDGKRFDEPAGTAAEGMTWARAYTIRAARQSGQDTTNEEKRAGKKLEGWTLKTLFEEYESTLQNGEGRKKDRQNFKHWQHIEDKLIEEISTQDIADVRKTHEKAGKAAETVKHIVNIVDRTVNFGIKSNLITPDKKKFFAAKPKIDKRLDLESMTDEQARKFLNAVESLPSKRHSLIFKWIFITGMRKTATLLLKWSDIDKDSKTILLRGETAKNRTSTRKSINFAMKKILDEAENLKVAGSDYIFCGEKGQPQHYLYRIARKIREQAGLEKSFRPFHGLRHSLATRLLSSGEVTLEQIQSLLTHKSIKSTEIYARMLAAGETQASEKAMKVLFETIDEKKISFAINDNLANNEKK